MASKSITRYHTRTIRARSVHHKTQITIPITYVVGMLPLAGRAVELYKLGGVQELKYLSQAFVPFDLNSKKWFTGDLIYGLYPILGAAVVHKIADKLGVNRALKSAGVPFIRV